MTQCKLPLSAAYWCFHRAFTAEPDDFCRLLKRLGITAVEMPPDEEVAVMRRHGLSVLNVAAAPIEESLGNIGSQQAVAGRITERISFAAANSIPHVIVFSGNRDSSSDDRQAEAHCISALRSLAPIAAEHGVTLLLEMLGQSDHPGYMLDRIAPALRIVSEVNSPQVKLLYDVYHMACMGEDVVEDLRRHQEWIGHIHLAACPHRTAPKAESVPDFQATVNAALQAGYQGFWGLEYLPADEDVIPELSQAVAFLQGTVA